MTPQELKNSILQRAIEGKLVEQRAEEGTGAELFEKIQKEKKKLVEEGKIKKQKSLGEIKDDEIPFDIPETWKWVRLGDVGEWAAGSTPLRTNLEFYGGEIPWLKTGDLNDGFITEVPEYITDLALSRTSLKLNPAGSVLIAMYGATIGKLGILKKPMTTNQACCACQPLDGIYNLYLFYFLMSSRRRLIKIAEGGAQPNISRTKIIGLSIPLSPLAEQKRIVEKIEELMPLVDEYEKNWKKLEKLNKKFPEDMKKSLLQEAIKGKLVEQRPEEGTGEELYKLIQEKKNKLVKEGKIKKQKPLEEIKEDEIPFDIPENWKWVRLGDVVNIVSSRRVHKSDWKSEGIPFYRAREIGKLSENGYVDNELFISEELFNKLSKSGVPQPGDLMVTAVGTLGKTYIVLEDDKFYYKDASVICFENFSNIVSEYLKFVMHSEMMMNQIRINSGGTTVATLTISRTSNYLIPLPPLAEQKRIVEKLDEMLPYCDELLKII